MKVLLIKANSISDFKEYKEKRISPSQDILSIASKIYESDDVEIIDETVGEIVDYRNKADLVGVFFSTPDTMRAYELSINFQELGKTVFLCALDTTFKKEEALTYSNSIIIGACEEMIYALLNDFKQEKLKKIYQRDTLFDMKKKKPFSKKLLSLKEYNYCFSIRGE